MVGKKHFRHRLIVGQSHASRVAACICLLHQLQITDNVLVIERITVKLLEQIECDMRLVLHQRITNYIQLVIKANGINFMTHLPESRGDVIFSLDFKFLFLAETIERVWRYKVLMNENDNPQLLFGPEGHTAMR